MKNKKRAAINIYTGLMLVALAALCFGVGFMWYQNVKLTEELQESEGGKNPYIFADPERRTN